MIERSYWVDLFTWTTWQEFLAAGGTTSGFRESNWSLVQRVQPGDYLLCYLVGIQRFIGLLEVISEPFKDTTPIWQDDIYPCRLGVKVLVALSVDTAVPIQDLRNHLSIFTRHPDARSWGVFLQRSPTRWKDSDGQAVVAALQEAQQNPVSRAVAQAKLTKKPQVLRTKKVGLVTVPEYQESSPEPGVEAIDSTHVPRSSVPVTEVTREASLHTEIQWLLLKLGNDMGLEVWAARNDRGRSFNGHVFGDLPLMKQSLPIQFDEATNRTIELIDVLWLRRNAIVAAFEIESTTSIYSGLLRMSDLLAMQPNLNIPLYLVAPDERRDKVITEINRPTFSRLTPPMHDFCRFIPFSVLRQRLEHLGPMLRYMKPEFLDELSESCALAGAQRQHQ